MNQILRFEWEANICVPVCLFLLIFECFLEINETLHVHNHMIV